jgi:hypothetical protein
LEEEKGNHSDYLEVVVSWLFPYTAGVLTKVEPSAVELSKQLLIGLENVVLLFIAA